MTMDLISRRTLFGNAERSSFSISPDGELLAFVAPRDGVRNIWVARRDAPDAGKPVTCDTHRGIASYQWTRDGRHVLFSMDNDGDEKWRVFIACVTTGAVRNLTPVDADRAYVVATSMGDPHHIVIGVHARDPRYADLYRVNLASGAAHLLEENPGFDEYLLGDDLNPRIATRTDLDGTMTILRRTADAAWEPWLTFDPAEAATSRAMGLDRAGRTLFMLDSRGHDTLALVSIDLADGTLATIAQDDRYDLGGYVGSWETFHPIAYVVTRQHRQTVPLTDGMARDVATIDAAGIGSWGITSRSDDDRWWTIGADSDVRPGLGYLYDRHGGTLHLLYETRPALRDAPLRGCTRCRSRPVTGWRSIAI
ncbi:TolB family protein [Sphingomonas hankookensis]|uniref:TolB family protein n=1 Tax=Sphingomonas hankookensis TaxID=563996 RepID=UPI003D303C56